MNKSNTILWWEIALRIIARLSTRMGMVTPRGYVWGINGSAIPLFLLDGDFIHFHKQAGGLLFYHLDHFKNHPPSWCVVRTISCHSSPRILRSTWTLRCYHGYGGFAALACSAFFLPSCMTVMEGSVDHRNLPVFWLQRWAHGQARLIISLLWSLNVQGVHLGLKQGQSESFNEISYMDAGRVSFSKAM